MRRLLSYKIGVKLKYEDNILLVQEVKNNLPSCTGCFFSNWYRHKNTLPTFNCCLLKLACTKAERVDKKHVVFIKIN